MVVIAGMIGVIRTHEFRRYSRCSDNSATSAELYTFNSVFLFSSINASLWDLWVITFNFRWQPEITCSLSFLERHRWDKFVDQSRRSRVINHPNYSACGFTANSSYRQENIFLPTGWSISLFEAKEKAKKKKKRKYLSYVRCDTVSNSWNDFFARFFRTAHGLVSHKKYFVLRQGDLSPSIFWIMITIPVG